MLSTNSMKRDRDPDPDPIQRYLTDIAYELDGLTDLPTAPK